ncbi:hypothetical protein PGT21_012993 [Puccinia graminis f. sp. tritici]|uniref:Uncharacterized protein n=1 Tax=Puccinia graminis f. sp. tritici TaxID=56615 RepID=A0A5B0M9K3_PUCGR|nr:hypothetical protein PGT21_012993 [Puccinia graminis f. sp. tritici]
MTVEWHGPIFLGVVLGFFNLTLATLPRIPEARASAGRFDESPNCEADVFRDLTPLESRPARHRGLVDDLYETLLNLQPHPLYPHGDPVHERGDSLFRHNHIPNGSSQNAPSDPRGSGSTRPSSIEDANSVIGNQAVEKVEHHFNRLKKPDSISGKHSIDEQTREADQSIFEPTPKSRRLFMKEWDELKDADNKGFILSVRRLGLKAFQYQDSERAAFTEQFKYLFRGELKTLALSSHEPTNLKNMNLRITTTREIGPNRYLAHVRVTKNGKIRLPRDLRTRVERIIDNLDVYHHLVNLGGLDRAMLGVQGSAYKDLLHWFFILLFRDNGERWPLLGQIEVPYILENPEKKFQSEAQKCVLNLLTDDGILNRGRGFKAAIELMGYWYEDYMSEIRRKYDPTNEDLLFSQEVYDRELQKALSLAGFPAKKKLEPPYKA